jgi:Gas vesicle synthesis protein GvpL/GvpF
VTGRRRRSLRGAAIDESRGGAEGRYVYGVVRPADVLSISSRGVGDGAASVGVLSHGDLGALVSPFGGEAVKANRRNLTAHSDVLQQAVAATTVVPMRFGVVMPSEEAVVDELLRARGEELHRVLDAVEGRVELSVKAFYRGDVALREVLRDDPAIARLSQATRGQPGAATYYDRIRLGELVADAVRAKRVADAAPILERLRLLAEDVAVDEELPERMVLKAAFLVGRERVPEFDRAVDEIGREVSERLQLKYLGPLAPHTFATFALPARAGSAA